MPPKRTVTTNQANGDIRSEGKKKKLQDSILPPGWYQNSKSKMFVGAHVSAAGGVSNAVAESAAIGGQAFALFLCNQRTFNVKPLEDDEVEKFQAACREYGYPLHLILPHGSYLMNPGSPEHQKLSQSRALFLDGMKRCERLGIKLYNFHPGSTVGKISVNECIDNIAESINYVLSNTSGVTAVIENMSKQGNSIGGDFKEIKRIIDRVKDKTRIGVCLDTCHTFAAGYDLRSDIAYEKTIQEFDDVVGFNYLKAIHLNDSKGACGDHLDRHEEIGKGQIGIKVFERIMRDKRFQGIPIVLETPDSNNYAKEIKMLYDVLE